MLPTCLIGGFAALILATSSSRNNYMICIQYFLYHSAIIAFALHLLLSDEIKWTVKDYFTCLKLLALFGLLAMYINSIVYDGVSDINFMYVVHAPQDGLPFLNTNHGWGVYMAHYASLAIFCVSMVYISPIINAIKAKFSKKENV